MSSRTLLRILPVVAACLAAPTTPLAAQSRGALPSIPVLRTTAGRWDLGAVLGPGGVDVRVGRRRSGGGGRATTAPTGRRGSTAARPAAVLATADRYVGTPYVWGGSTPRGFDCSGFVQYVFRRHGVALPRTSREQVGAGRKVRGGVGTLRTGDLMFFASRGRRIDHVALYAGNGRILHATSSGGGVRYDRLSTRRGRWFVAHHVASRRVVADGRSLVRELGLAAHPVELDPPDLAPSP